MDAGHIEEESTENRLMKDDEATLPGTSSDTSSSSTDEEFVEREKWGSKFEFILACVGFSVAYGNLMRFPYLCIRNGGGAFLIPFFMFMLVLGFPLYYLEVCLGQFSGSSPLFVWRLAPLLKGIGWLMILISGIVSWYYNTIIAWVLYYLYNSFRSTLPWSTCDNEWNTENCRPSDPEAEAALLLKLNETKYTNLNASDVIVRNISSSKEFWQNNVLGMSPGIDQPGTVQMHLAISLLGAWVLVFLCLIKGVKSVGKVVYVTAILPYVLLIVFFFRGITLPGSWDGIRFFLTTDFNKLKNAQVWLEAAVQVFYSLGPVWGGVITMSSYNKFRNNCLRDTLIACLADGLTSFFAGFVVFAILGYMAHELGQPIEEVATAGPGLMFIAYPEAISRMPVPQLWAVLFFIMLITVGLDTQFGMFETLSSGIVDAFPSKLAKRKMLVTAMVACGMFLCALPFCTRAGIYIYNLVDWYASALCMALGGMLELIAVGWYYGADRFSNDMVMMLGRPAPILLRVLWCIVSPLTFAVIFIITLVRYDDVSYQGYTYPDYAISIGNVVALVPILPIPICFLYELLRSPGTIKQRFTTLMKPESWRPNDRKLWQVYDEIDRPNTSKLSNAYIRETLIGTSPEVGVPASPEQEVALNSVTWQ